MEKRRNRKSKALVGWVLIIMVLLQGCAAVKPQSSLMVNQIELKKCKEDASKLWWEKPGFDWHQYNKVMLEPMGIKIEKNNFQKN